MVEVYVDIVFAVNFLMDFLILWTTAKIINVKTRPCRLLLGAAAGGLCALAVLFFEATLVNTLIVKIAFSVLILLVTFAPLSPSAFLHTFAFFYLVSFITGGAVIGFIYLADSTPGVMRAYNGALMLSSKFNYYRLIIGTAAALLLAVAGFLFAKRNVLQRELIRTVKICIGESAVTVQAYLDTGNQLADPLTKKPVIVVECAALKEYLPEEILGSALVEDEKTFAHLAKCVGGHWASRLHIIPFNSVGKSRGIMLGIRPDYVEINHGGEAFRTSEIIIGLTGGALSKEGKYQALLHPDVCAEQSRFE